jgi:predicted nucleotidyltransferase
VRKKKQAIFMKRDLGCLNKAEREVIDSFVKELREKLGDEIVFIRLFGSKARGDFLEDSDIDIFVLVKEKTADVRDKLAEITANYDIEYGLPLSTVLYDLFEYGKNKELGSFFFENVEREGIAL